MSHLSSIIKLAESVITIKSHKIYKKFKYMLKQQE